MIRRTIRALWQLLGGIELTLLTSLLYALSFLPARSRGGWYRRLFRVWCSAWVDALGVDLRLQHRNRHPLPSRFILVANHPSSFEDIGIPALFDVDSLAKAEVRDWWIVGRIGAAAGTLYVKRDSPDSRAAAARALAQRLAEGRSVALYPEGGIKGPHLQPRFHYGAFTASLQTGVPIVPVYLHYEALHDFHWGDHGLLRNLGNILRASNNRANYFVFDAIDPRLFHDKMSYSAHVHRLYEDWQARHLD